jgi:hypothetical protein
MSVITGETKIGFKKIKGTTIKPNAKGSKGKLQFYFDEDVRGSFITIGLSMVGMPDSLDVRFQVFIGNELMGGAHIRRDRENMVIAENSFSMYLPGGSKAFFDGISGGQIDSFKFSVHRIFLSI